MFALPNALTILRILLVPVFVVTFMLPGEAARLVAFAVFTLAGVSDWLDGFAARKLKAGSDFGRMLDPIADKVLVAVALMMLVAEGTFRRYNPATGGSALSLLRAGAGTDHPWHEKSWYRACANSWPAPASAFRSPPSPSSKPRYRWSPLAR